MVSRLRAIVNPKLRRRATVVIANSINGLVVPILNPIVSLLVIRLASAGLWGEFVNVLIVAQLGTHVIVWGNKDYLVREFSRNSARIAAAWQTCLITRLALFAAFGGLIGLMGYSPLRAGLLVLWCLGLVLDQSFDALILYKKDFALSTVIELGGLAVMAMAIASAGSRIDLDSLIALSSAVALLKAAVLLLHFRAYTLSVAGKWLAWSGRFDARYFALAFPFFLLGFSGLLQSRIDLYTVNYFLPKSAVGQYQVLTTFLIYLQSISAFILMPFVKNLYRLGYRAILALSAKLFVFGALLLLPALAVIQLVLRVHYRFDFPLHFVVVGGVFALPVYFYLPIIYALYKAGAQSIVVKINGFGIAVNLLLSLLLLPRVGIIGALTAAAVAQWAMFAAYLLQSRAIRDEHVITLPELS
jgi:O-antigen/teichoic acid export membrane protein